MSIETLIHAREALRNHSDSPRLFIAKYQTKEVSAKEHLEQAIKDVRSRASTLVLTQPTFLETLKCRLESICR